MSLQGVLPVGVLRVCPYCDCIFALFGHLLLRDLAALRPCGLVGLFLSGIDAWFLVALRIGALSLETCWCFRPAGCP